MKTAKQREEEFRKDLKDLLFKHSADLEITDDQAGYGMHSGIAIVTMSPEYDEDGILIADYTEFTI